MNNLTKKLIKSHNLTLKQMKQLKEQNRIILFNEYKEGFLSFISGDEYDILFSAAINNIYGYKMWKDLLTYLDKSNRNIFLSFGDNNKRLFEAVEKRFKNKYTIIDENSLIIIKE